MRHTILVTCLLVLVLSCGKDNETRSEVVEYILDCHSNSRTLECHTTGITCRYSGWDSHTLFCSVVTERRGKE